jgi:hypothetical protein
VITYSHAAFLGTAKREEGGNQESRELHDEQLVGLLDKEGCKRRFLRVLLQRRQGFAVPKVQIRR